MQSKKDRRAIVLYAVNVIFIRKSTNSPPISLSYGTMGRGTIDDLTGTIGMKHVLLSGHYDWRIGRISKPSNILSPAEEEKTKVENDHK